MCILPLNSRTSFSHFCSVTSGCEEAGIPACAARHFQQEFLEGVIQSNSPDSICRSNSAFSPTYEEIIFFDLAFLQKQSNQNHLLPHY
jgi:hypothetical protein